MAKLSPFATPSATREVLERHGLYTKYGLGQNFLINDDIIAKILDLAEVNSNDCILEVGPGIGTLTYALLGHAKHVVAIEKDPDLPEVLADTLSSCGSNFTLVTMDALDLSDQILDKVCSEDSITLPNKLVSNLPYAVAATVVLDYFQRIDSLGSATVMVQKEVADRMMAEPGNKTYGAYTVKFRLFAKPTGRFLVAPGNFFPPPHVESSVLRLERIVATDAQGMPLNAKQLDAICVMADAAFATRRKTIANSCKTYFASDPQIQASIPTILETAGIDSRRRGETLTEQEFIELGLAYFGLAQSMK